jgi:exodeoxyribonuclease VII small subunit
MAKTEKKENPGFEKALADLEAIVAKLEKGGLALNDSLELFEKGVKLAHFLREELGRAEKKVEILLKDEKGQVKAEPFKLEEEDEEEDADKDDENEKEPSGDPGEVPF